MELNLSGKKAVVCGSTRGIGYAVAMELASMGASVTLIARNPEALKHVLGSLPVSNSQIHDSLVADFSKPEGLRAALSSYVARTPVVHILVNNSGGPKGGPIAEAQTEEFVGTFAQHLLCNHILVQSFIAGMKKVAYGRIINIISSSVKQPIPNLGVSNTIRGAVASWAKTLAGELGQFNITVNNVLPGTTKTGRLDSLIKARAEKLNVQADTVAAEMIAEIPARRFAEPREVAAVVAFLASPAAAYINGINLPVDGGRLNCL